MIKGLNKGKFSLCSTSKKSKLFRKSIKLVTLLKIMPRTLLSTKKWRKKSQNWLRQSRMVTICCCRRKTRMRIQHVPRLSLLVTSMPLFTRKGKSLIIQLAVVLKIYIRVSWIVRKCSFFNKLSSVTIRHNSVWTNEINILRYQERTFNFFRREHRQKVWLIVFHLLI